MRKLGKRVHVGWQKCFPDEPDKNNASIPDVHTPPRLGPTLYTRVCSLSFSSFTYRCTSIRYSNIFVLPLITSRLRPLLRFFCHRTFVYGIPAIRFRYYFIN